MAKFKFYLENQKDEHEMVLDYDNETSELRYENGDIVVPQDVFKNFKPFFKMDEGKRNLKKIKIQLGLKCNNSCKYFFSSTHRTHLLFGQSEHCFPHLINR